MAIDLNALARLGAAARLRELDTERAAILQAFPTLGSAERPPAERKRRTMSAAGIAAIRAGTKRRWARWRKARAAEKASGE